MSSLIVKNKKILDQINQMFQSGESMQSIATVLSIPRAIVAASITTESKEAISHALAEETIEIADDDSVNPAHNRNRIQARQWLAGKYNKEYSDKMMVDVTHHVDISEAMRLARTRVRLGVSAESEDIEDAIMVSDVSPDVSILD